MLAARLASVIRIDDLHRAGKVLIGQVPNPFGAVAPEDMLLRATQPRFQAFRQMRWFFSRFDGFEE